MRFPRSAGVLLHPTSLPGPDGIGSFGRPAYEFIDFLKAAGMSLWQVLPLGPTGYGNAPYGCFSAFAGNPLMISLAALREEGLLTARDLQKNRFPSTAEVNEEAISTRKDALLNRAFDCFWSDSSQASQNNLRDFCLDPNRSAWLEDYALFMALKERAGGEPWTRWDLPLVHRQPAALSRARDRLSRRLWFQRFLQWKFTRQWSSLRDYAHRSGVQILGDMPIYVSDDSADVWSHPEFFHLDEAGNRTVVAGVPPDYFSKTGQLWGNPLYRWDRMERTGYRWWVARFRTLFETVDRVRIDHFRGFEAYWEIPAKDKTAENGRWVKGPGEKLFLALHKHLGELPVIAEDLGVITPPVEALRDGFGFPGMKILQFAFGGDASNPYLPHNYVPNSVVFTGTHDNDTTKGWMDSMDAAQKRVLQRYMGGKRTPTPWDVIGLAMASVSDTCLLPLQDVLGLDTKARMNVPSVAQGNWKWRYLSGALRPALADRLREMAEIYGRAPARAPKKAL